MMINAAEVISEFKQIDKPIRVIAEESADGVIAAYIFCEFLKKNGKKFQESRADLKMNKKKPKPKSVGKI